MSTVEVDVDFIEELRLRRWAHQNYVPPEQRDSSWHPVVLDEMGRKDLDVSEPAIAHTPPDPTPSARADPGTVANAPPPRGRSFDAQ